MIATDDLECEFSCRDQVRRIKMPEGIGEHYTAAQNFELVAGGRFIQTDDQLPSHRYEQAHANFSDSTVIPFHPFSALWSTETSCSTSILG